MLRLHNSQNARVTSLRINVSVLARCLELKARMSGSKSGGFALQRVVVSENPVLQELYD